MTIDIDILNVGDGDAILLTLCKNDKNLVMLIDGGHPGDAEMVKTKLDEVLAAVGKKGPDIILCTHFDNDHIGSLYELVEYYHKNIGCLYIHDASVLKNITGVLKKSTVENASVLPSENDDVFGNYYFDPETDESVKFVVESLQQEADLLKLAGHLKVPTKRPVAGAIQLADWPEIRIIAPTQVYYDQLFPPNLKPEVALQEEVNAYSAELVLKPAPVAGDPCRLLDRLTRSPVSRINLASAILEVNLAGDKFLFTADAGIPSFKNIPNYEQELRHIFWLKVPHHGSRNNFTGELIDLIRPKIAAISGKIRIEPGIIACLVKHGCTVERTDDPGADLHYHYEYPEKSVVAK